MRQLTLTLLFVFPCLANAQWSGIAMSIEQERYQWDFGGSTREARTDRFILSIEENTESNVRIGINLGSASIRVEGNTPATNQKFEASFVGFYLRKPLEFNDFLSIYGNLSYRYNVGYDDTDPDPLELQWSQGEVQMGLSMTMGGLRITPYAAYHSINGDIGTASGTEFFGIDDPITGGLRIDYFVDDTAFIRLDYQTGDYSGGFLRFARQF